MSINNNFGGFPSNSMNLQPETSISLTNYGRLENRNLPEKSLTNQKRRIEVEDGGEYLPVAKKVFAQLEANENPSQEGTGMEFWDSRKVQNEAEEKDDAMSLEPTQSKIKLETLCEDALSSVSSFLKGKDVNALMVTCKQFNPIRDKDSNLGKLKKTKEMCEYFQNYQSHDVYYDGTYPLQSTEFDTHVLRTIEEYKHGTLQNGNSFVINRFGKEEWMKFLGDPGNVPPLPDNIHEELQRPCPFWPNKKVEQTHRLVLIPKTVNRIFYNLDVLNQLLAQSKFGQRIGISLGVGEFTKDNFHSITSLRKFIAESEDQDEETGVDESYWALITNTILPRKKMRDFSFKGLEKNENEKIEGLLYEEGLEENDELEAHLNEEALEENDEGIEAEDAEIYDPDHDLLLSMACRVGYNNWLKEHGYSSGTVLEIATGFLLPHMRTESRSNGSENNMRKGTVYDNREIITDSFFMDYSWGNQPIAVELKINSEEYFFNMRMKTEGFYDDIINGKCGFVGVKRLNTGNLSQLLKIKEKQPRPSWGYWKLPN